MINQWVSLCLMLMFGSYVNRVNLSVFYTIMHDFILSYLVCGKDWRYRRLRHLQLVRNIKCGFLGIRQYASNVTWWERFSLSNMCKQIIWMVIFFNLLIFANLPIMNLRDNFYFLPTQYDYFTWFVCSLHAQCSWELKAFHW